ncbi:MAG: hypothetical protein IPJ82_21370 [Lewinellaceae bacterium]|nr:hypothetical protein [Lewinellaceae bacterium]
MHFQPDAIYHIYNQDDNRQQTFFREENYLDFLKKMRTFILPHVDFLAYCLMRNHFHWLIHTKQSACNWINFLSGPDKTVNAPPRQQLNHQINIVLRSYTRAINNQENRSGSLFRQHTKAQNGWVDEFIDAAKRKNGTDDFTFGIGNDYALQCFHYIHGNPVRAGMVKNTSDWPYSSARDYAGIRNGNLCNQLLTKELLGFM